MESTNDVMEKKRINAWNKEFRAFAEEQDVKVTVERTGSAITLTKGKGLANKIRSEVIVSSTILTMQYRQKKCNYFLNEGNRRIIRDLAVLYWTKMAEIRGLEMVVYHYDADQPADFKELGEEEKELLLNTSSYAYDNVFYKELKEGFLDDLLLLVRTIQQELASLQKEDPTFTYKAIRQRSLSAYSCYFCGETCVLEVTKPRNTSAEGRYRLSFDQEVIHFSTMEELSTKFALMVDTIHKSKRIKTLLHPPRHHFYQYAKKHLQFMEPIADILYEHLVRQYTPEEIEQGFVKPVLMIKSVISQPGKWVRLLQVLNSNVVLCADGEDNLFVKIFDLEQFTEAKQLYDQITIQMMDKRHNETIMIMKNNAEKIKENA